ncbi:MAG TPA: zinc ribbon domain-containing protein [Archangium sp.]|nr:zinc ribbon domain-containing protein [Archangium sp.]
MRYIYLLRMLVVCGKCGMRMSCFRRAQSNGRGDYHYYGCSRGPEDGGRAARCKAQYLRADALDATVWSALCQWLREPRILVEEAASWQERREGEEASAPERVRLESTCRNLKRQVERLVDAYQQGALRVDELKVRRAQLEAALEAARARAKELQAQHADEERLGEREAQLEAFAAAVREGLDALDFEGRQRLVRLLIDASW